jgi:C4-dicarboxylate transporter DctM subunit
VAVVVALFLAIFAFGLRWKGLKEALIDAASVNGMILFILVAATYFTYVVGSTNAAERILLFVRSASIPKWEVIVAINVILLILGCIIDPITITLLTIPIFHPVIVNLGLDPIWFGIVFCVNTQIGLITPPMGIDLFAIKTVFEVSTLEILRGVMPFLLSEIAFLVLISACPSISLWLPSMMIGK